MNERLQGEAMTSAGRILVVDDEQGVRSTLAAVLRDEGFDVETAESGEDCLSILRERSFQAILLDVWLPGRDGLDTLKQLRRSGVDAAVIMISGHGTIETAVRATRMGAHDFVEKPLSLDKIVLTLRNALRARKLEERNRLLLRELRREVELIGESGGIRRLRERIEAAAPTGGGVLITGEKGAGKELAARLIHAMSPRAEEAFIEVACAAVPSERILVELFGRAGGPGGSGGRGGGEGAQAGVPGQGDAAGIGVGAQAGPVGVDGPDLGGVEGADGPAGIDGPGRSGAAGADGPGGRGVKGKLELAHEGTLYLSDVEALSPEAQQRLLRVLDTKRFLPVDGHVDVTADVRPIAASEKSLEAEVAAGRFREDLYFKLNVVPMDVPPLRDRREDVPLLVEHFLERYAREYGRASKMVQPEAMEAFSKYSWPGNVRELRNVVERIVILAPAETITIADLPDRLVPDLTGHFDPSSRGVTLQQGRRAFEKRLIQERLHAMDGNISRTAESLGIERSNLYRKIKAYGIRG